MRNSTKYLKLLKVYYDNLISAEHTLLSFAKQKFTSKSKSHKNWLQFLKFYFIFWNMSFFEIKNHIAIITGSAQGTVHKNA